MKNKILQTIKVLTIVLLTGSLAEASESKYDQVKEFMRQSSDVQLETSKAFNKNRPESVVRTGAELKKKLIRVEPETVTPATTLKSSQLQRKQARVRDRLAQELLEKELATLESME